MEVGEGAIVSPFGARSPGPARPPTADGTGDRLLRRQALEQGLLGVNDARSKIVLFEVFTLARGLVQHPAEGVGEVLSVAVE